MMWLACTDPASQDSAATRPEVTDSPAPEAPTWTVGTIGTVITVSWTQSEAGETALTWTLDDVAHTSPPIWREAGPASERVLGLPYDTEVEVRVSGTGAPAEGVLVRTDPLPDGMPTPSLVASVPELQTADTPYLLGSINAEEVGWDAGTYWSFLLDRQGRVVWAQPGADEDFSIQLRVGVDGTILRDVSTWWSRLDDGVASVIERVTIDGTITETIATPGLHHPFTELADGTLIYAEGYDQSERIVERAPDGTLRTIWDCATFYEAEGIDDWCHSNAIFHDATRDRLFLSSPGLINHVLELDRPSGAELARYGRVDGALRFDPPESMFTYQHGVSWTEAGTLLLSTHVAPGNDIAVVREYTVEEGVLVEQWSFGEDYALSAVSAGEAHRLIGGNTLRNAGTSPRIQEVTPAGDVVWDVDFGGYRLLGRTTFVADLYAIAAG